MTTDKPTAADATVRSAEAVRALTATLDAALEGESAARATTPCSEPRLEQLRERLNQHLAQTEALMEDYHEQSMELAMGVSECFEVLEDVQRGELAVSVGDGTTGSPVELVARLGKTLNRTIARLREQRTMIERQRSSIQELSTPVLEVDDGVLALPIIGVLDSARMESVTERLLDAIATLHADCVILDVTGVELVDTQTADHLIRITRSVRLMGARCVLTGIRPVATNCPRTRQWAKFGKLTIAVFPTRSISRSTNAGRCVTCSV